jgi:ABC-type antimicrobial peptide transport system permease subunit
MQPDAFMFLVSIALCFVTSLFFGLMPAIRFSRPSMISALKDESAGGGGRRVGRTHRIAATVQAAIAVPFLVIAVIKLDQVRTVTTADLGFATGGLYALPLSAGSEMPPPAEVAATLTRLPGVSSVAVADGLPLDFVGRYVRTSGEATGTARWIHVTRVDAGFMKTLGIPVLMGRTISEADRSGTDLVTVVTEPLARMLFPDGDVLGRQLTLTWDGGTHGTYTVIGVAGDLVASQMASPRVQLFVPLAQHPVDHVMVIARSSASAESMHSSLAQLLPDMDPTVLHGSLITGDRLLQRSANDLATQSAVAAACGSVALILTALGVFGVVGFLVASRTREIGVRIALGASRSRVLTMVLLDTVRLVSPGIILGLVLALVAVKSDAFELSVYELGIVEPLTYTFAAAVTVVVALLSGLSPARRAARVEPLVAMRTE